MLLNIFRPYDIVTTIFNKPLNIIKSHLTSIICLTLLRARASGFGLRSDWLKKATARDLLGACPRCPLVRGAKKFVEVLKESRGFYLKTIGPYFSLGTRRPDEEERKHRERARLYTLAR